MPNKEVVLNLKNYTVDTINFNTNYNFNSTLNPLVNLKPLFKKSYNEIDESNILVKLSVEIKDESLPFSLKVQISGLFGCENWKDSNESQEIVRFNTIAILFPYLRSLVTNITNNAEIPPVILPIVNTRQLFNE